MNEGHASAQRINQYIEQSQQAFMDSVSHPADRDQGRGLDPVSHRRGLFSPIVDGFMYCIIRMASALMSDDEAMPEKPLKASALPDLESREAASWFHGWWCGIAVGAVIGIGFATVLFTSGVLK